jgi:hypothetical protein
MLRTHFLTRLTTLVRFAIFIIVLAQTSESFGQNTPIAGDDENFTYQDIAVTGNVFDNDYDLDGDELTFSIVSGTTDGVWDLLPNGDYTYTPNQYVIGIETLVYQACDEDGMCDQATLTMYVIFLNDAPIANDDSFFAEINTARTFNARLNDVEPDNEIMLFYMLAPPANGTATINISTGVITYTPNTGFTGSDSFTYQACDPCFVCNQAQVNVTVLPANAPPVFGSVNVIATEDQMTTGNLSSFVTDAENDNLTFGLLTNSPNGNVSVLSNGSYTFTPSPNFNGQTSFLIQACDIVGQCTSAIAIVNVASVNDAPTALNDSFVGNEDANFNGNVATNDSDIESGTLVYSVLNNPIAGTLTMQTNGQFQFIPPFNEFGTYSFTYQVCDAQSACASATAIIQINPVNDAPVSVADSFNTSEDNVLTGTVANDIDIDSPNLTYSYTSGAANGNITINADGSFTYVPNSNWFGNETIVYEVCDNQNACSTGLLQIIVTYINDAPVIEDENYNVNEDASLNGNVGSNDNNQGEGTIAYTVASDATNGTLTLSGNGTFTYQPNANWYGTEIIQYSGCNANNACDGGTLTITVNPINDAPLCTPLFLALEEDGTAFFNPANAGFDIDSPGLELSIENPAFGTIQSIDSNAMTYTVNANYNGTDAMSLTFCDGSDACCVAQISITIAPLNDTPIASDGSFEGTEDNMLSGQMPSATDIDGDEITYLLISAPMNGDVTIQTNGAFTYTPYENSNGIDFFTYSACDANDACDAAIVTIEINSINDTPSVTNESNVCPLDLSIAGDVSENDSDIETSQMTYNLLNVIGTAANFNLNENGTYTFAPAQVGFTTIEYQACDEDGLCVTGFLTIETIDFNTAPLAGPGEFETNEDTTLSVSLSALVNDNEGGTLTFVLISGDNNAVSSISSEGILTLTPTANYFGPINLSYQVCDNGNLCGTSSILINVNPVNDAPIASALEFIAYQDNFFTGQLNTGIIDDGNGPFVFQLLDTDAPGVLAINSNGQFTFDPAQYQIGNFNITYSVCDAGGLCDIVDAALYILYLNDVPVAEDVFISTDEEQDYSGSLLSYVYEADQEALSFNLLAQPLHGVVTLNLDGTFTYSPDAEYSGLDSFSYIACDAMGTCDDGDVTIEVVFMNDLPVATDDFFMVLEDDDVSGTVATNDVELDDEIDSYTIYSQPSHGTLELNDNGSFTYVPFPNYYGLDQALIMMCDPCGACDISVLEFEVTFINDMPIVEDESIFVYQNTSFEGNVSTNDYELDIEELTYFIINDNSNGIFVLNDNGSFSYIPGDDALGIFTVEYMACDPCGACSYGLLTIEVGPLEGGNTAPITNPISEDACAGLSTVIDIGPYIFDLQEDDSLLSISYGQPSEGFVTSNGTELTYYSNVEFPGIVTIEYQVCDNGQPSLCSSSTISVNVYPVENPLVSELYVENVSCFGGSNGYIDIIATESLGNVTITWFNGDNSSIQDNLSAGYYEFTLTSDALCSQPSPYGITVSEPVTGISVEANVVGINNIDSGFIDLNITGGQEPYTVTWSGISGIPDGTGLMDITSAGTYYASIEDAYGCSFDTSFVISSLDEISNLWNVACWPNPATDELIVQVTGRGGALSSMQVTDVTGRIVSQQQLGILSNTHTESINVAALSPGHYQIVILSDGIQKTLRFVKN